MDQSDYSKYYSLEKYLFQDVLLFFQRTHTLTTFHFFCIVVWKANRAKSKVAARLLAKGHDTLNDAVAALLKQIDSAADPKERLKILISDWKFRLPIASAILSVLFPHEFTIYDVRVCESLGGFSNIQYKTSFDNLWIGYSEYVAAVKAAVPGYQSLRDKDRFLWGRSFATQLENDIANSFVHTSKETNFEPRRKRLR